MSIVVRVTRNWEVEVEPVYGDSDEKIKDKALATLEGDHVTETVSILPQKETVNTNSEQETVVLPEQSEVS